jgi:hypothetical protein
LSEKSRLTQAFATFAEQQLTLTRTSNLTQAFRNCCWARWNMSAGRYSGMAMAQTLGMANDLVARVQPIDKPGLFLAVSQLGLQRSVVARTARQKDDRIARVRTDGGRAAAQYRALECSAATAATCQ